MSPQTLTASFRNRWEALAAAPARAEDTHDRDRPPWGPRSLVLCGDARILRGGLW